MNYENDQLKLSSELSFLPCWGIDCDESKLVASSIRGNVCFWDFAAKYENYQKNRKNFFLPTRNKYLTNQDEKALAFCVATLLSIGTAIFFIKAMRK